MESAATGKYINNFTRSVSLTIHFTRMFGQDIQDVFNLLSQACAYEMANFSIFPPLYVGTQMSMSET